MKPKVVILCGGKGTRLREKTENKPKPLLSIGNYPILWHIMKHYSHYGFNDFILCLGYKGELIKEYFIKYKNRLCDVQLNLKDGIETIIQDGNPAENWNIIFANTGLETNTGGRIKKIEKYINEEYFFLTYGDGLSNVSIEKLEGYFKQKGKIGVITGIRPQSRFGQITIEPDCIVTGFKEKPLLNDYANGGFCVFHRKIFDYMDDNCVLEQEVFEQLVNERELAIYKHEGFWKCMDTYKDYKELNEIWDHGNPQWKVY
ncbi:Glucose-1-phosphate cytidylyltransferase [Pelotomaculum schinkii]|uniref:Glucose-1-phosphate cytidylyltransferase n=1 Tax=Pelotomaculum schinkii TaxID=78350 RepID=A0A4Y7R9G0_9FIRM|nr:glucose-1-phosphate cytidylyltransferase [Pelotomaculum schinkii]TEB05280.1 Glucose-1-phosphate cytidylyltransferase [Pelotomaculum schinkii]